MWIKCKNYKSKNGLYVGQTFMGHIHNCQACELRNKCLRKATTKARQVVIFDKSADQKNVNYIVLMQKRFDTPESRSMYSRRMGTVEPVFGHIAGTKRLNRFTLRGNKKVNTQWLLFCMVHNVGKIQKYAS